MIKHDYFKTNMQKYGLVIFVVFWGSYNNVSSKTPLNGSLCATKFGLQEGKKTISKHVLRILLYKRGNNLNIVFFFKFIYKFISADLFSSPDIQDDV